MDYPSLIMKFTLLIQAGMTVRRAFQKISSDYLRNCPKEGRYAYEAVTTTCHEMDSGVAELEAYRRFGERCGQMKYKTFYDPDSESPERRTQDGRSSGKRSSGSMG